jgi:teichuronic acid biosynthesis glycosyltransferase TuaC
VRVVVVAEYYPREDDPALGVWAHRQALAARDAGAEVRVLVLHRLVPPKAALRDRDLRALTAPLRQSRRARLDGIEVAYVPYVAPPRDRGYGHWSAWAAPALRLALRRAAPFDLVHAHYAAPAGDAVRRTGRPYVVSVHGGDVLGLAERFGIAGRRAVERGLAGARLVLANSAGTAARARELGGRDVRVLHLGTDVPQQPTARPGGPLVTVANLVARKRHADVLRALGILRDSHPDLRWEVVGDGPERPALERLARDLGVEPRVRFHGRLAPAEALAISRRAGVFVLPSADEAFGVGYVEAMAAGVPAIGCRGEHGPEEIAAAGPGMLLVPPADPTALAAELARLADEPDRCAAVGAAARATVQAAFTWERCGRETVAAYEAAR